MFTRAFNLVSQFVENRNAPGAVALIGHDGRTYGPHAYGTTSFFPNAPSMTSDTIFDLASLSKVVGTTTATLILLEQGYFRLDDSLQHFFPHAPEDKKAITLRQLLTHTSGIPWWVPLYETIAHPDQAVDTILKLPLSYKPGEKVEYSCIGFILLGKLIEKLTNQSLDTFLKEQVFQPLGMNDTGYCPPENKKERIVHTEWCPRRKDFLHGIVHDENAQGMRGISGNAGLFSTASDLAKFCGMMLGEGSFEGKRILSSRTLQLLKENYTPGLNDRRTLGWLLKSDTHCSGGDLISSKAIGHTGFTGTSIWIDPELNGFFILLTNRVHPHRDNNAIIRLRPLFHNTAIADIIDI